MASEYAKFDMAFIDDQIKDHTDDAKKFTHGEGGAGGAAGGHGGKPPGQSAQRFDDKLGVIALSIIYM